jgi:hypothetical protein
VTQVLYSEYSTLGGGKGTTHYRTHVNSLAFEVLPSPSLDTTKNCHFTN